MNIKISYLIILAALCGSFQLQAQQKTATKDTTTLTRELTLEKEYNPSIRDASKVNQLPEIKEPEAPKTQVEFANYSVPLDIKPQLYILQSKPYFTELATSGKRGYLSAGVSTFVDIDGDLGYQILNSEKDQLSLFGSHRSSNGNVTYLQDDYKQKMKINDNRIGMDFMHNFGKIRLNADFQYLYSGFNYYGWTVPEYSSSSVPLFEELNIDKDLNQVNNSIDFNAGISSEGESDELAYMLKIGYATFNQKYAAYESLDGPKENRFRIGWDVHKGFNTDMAIGLGGYLKNYSMTVPKQEKLQFTGFDGYSNLLLNPYFTMEGSNWDLQLGAKINFLLGDSNSVNFAPNINFTYHPLEKMSLYIQMDGGVQDNGLYSMFGENRYVSPMLRIKDSQTSFDASVGIKSAIASNWWFDVFAGYKHTKDEHFFIPVAGYNTENSTQTYLAGNLNAVQYMDVNVFKMGGSLKYAYQDLFEFGLKATFYQWDVPSKHIDNGGRSVRYEAWNKPTFETDLNIGFRIPQLPLHLNAIYHLETGRKALFEESVKMKNINDLKIRGTYTINDTFSIFGQVNNLLFQKYDLWYGYPAQNFSFMGGLNIRF